MKIFAFWQSWLFYSSLLFACWGLLLAIDPNAGIFKHYNEALLRQLALPENSDDLRTFRSFMAGPLGGTIAGYYLLTALVTKYAFSKKEKWARNSITFSFGIWAIVDCAVALQHQVYFHVVVLNGISIFIKTLPLVFTWNQFKTKNLG